MIKELSDISWQVSEKEYRADSALSYSTLSTYEREGKFDKIPTLFDRKESSALQLGSIVDTLITGSEEEYRELFLADDYECPDTISKIVKPIFITYSSKYGSLEEVPNEIIINLTEQFGYQLNWKPETRAKVIKEKGAKYYGLLYLAGNRTIITTETESIARRMVNALKTSPATGYLFAANNPFDEAKRYYQLKFKANIDGIDFRIMMDLCLVLYDKKIIIPIDLKTSGKPEYNFFKSFLEWRYDLQGKLYTAVLRKTLDADDYFKDFKIEPYIFAVVNKNTLNPLTWEFSESVNMNDFKVGNTTYRNPVSIAKELKHYLDTMPTVPEGILLDKSNSITEWINKYEGNRVVEQQ